MKIIAAIFFCLKKKNMKTKEISHGLPHESLEELCINFIGNYLFVLMQTVKICGNCAHA
jgi:hypothetical protein